MEPKLDLRHICLFAMYGALMYASKVITEVLPNIHLIGMFTMVFTLVYRKKALIPIYVFVFLTGLIHAGFSLWWVPYLYLWAVLWAVTMLLPRNLPNGLRIPLYMAVCALHGLCYGTLYAPFQALAFGYDLKQTLAWIAAGFPWDVIHALGNLAAGTLIVPLVRLLQAMEARYLS